ncbi:MAG: hypothetical protein HKN23_20355 [Verrucomicrobiales bacterium]|nr:hypothetical protein [Verrucomicrobiales bacterium]
MKTKFTQIALIAFLAAGTSSVFAGGWGGKYVVSEKNPIAKNPVPAPCYGAGYEFGIFAAGIFPNGTGDYEEALGGGVSLGYFYNENLGFDLGAAVFSTDSEVHNYTLDLVYRFPNQQDCYAPYVFIGGGVHTNGETEGLARGGLGLDVKMTDSCSIFADGAYNYVAGDVEDYITVRVGLRFNF